jgi:hypothetical protein
MKTFLQRFALLVAGVLQGFDRLVFKGKLCQLYSPEGINCLLCANRVLYKDFKSYAAQVTAEVLKASLISEARAQQRFRYLNSSNNTDKEQVAGNRRRAAHQNRPGVRLAVRGTVLDLRQGNRRGWPCPSAWRTRRVLPPVPLLPPSPVRLAVRSPADLVPLRDSGRPQWPGMAGAANGPGKVALCPQ